MTTGTIDFITSSGRSTPIEETSAHSHSSVQGFTKGSQRSLTAQAPEAATTASLESGPVLPTPDLAVPYAAPKPAKHHGSPRSGQIASDETSLGHAGDSGRQVLYQQVKASGCQAKQATRISRARQPRRRSAVRASKPAKQNSQVLRERGRAQANTSAAAAPMKPKNGPVLSPTHCSPSSSCLWMPSMLLTCYSRAPRLWQMFKANLAVSALLATQGHPLVDP